MDLTYSEVQSKMFLKKFTLLFVSYNLLLNLHTLTRLIDVTKFSMINGGKVSGDRSVQ